MCLVQWSFPSFSLFLDIFLRFIYHMFDLVYFFFFLKSSHCFPFPWPPIFPQYIIFLTLNLLVCLSLHFFLVVNWMESREKFKSPTINSTCINNIQITLYTVSPTNPLYIFNVGQMTWSNVGQNAIDRRSGGQHHNCTAFKHISKDL